MTPQPPADPIDFVWAVNWNRRHLDGGAKQIASAKFAIAHEAEARARQGARTDLGTNLYQGAEDGFGRSREMAAEKFGVGEQTVANAIKVVRQGVPELVGKVEQDKVSVSAAADVATLPQEEQRKIVERGPRAVVEAAKEIRV
jgi:hypothetical protein